MARTPDRKGLDYDFRFMLAEGDLDRVDKTIEELTERMSRILWALLGILVSTTTASVLLALNLAVGK